MPRPLAIAFSIAAALALTCQPADAFLRRHKKVSPAVQTTVVGAGIASTVTYWSLLDWSLNKHSSSYNWGAAAAVTFGCMVLAPMVGSALKRDQLTLREAYVLEGSCIVPIIGGWLVNAAFDANPQWEAGTTIKVAHKRKKKM